jgi:hypothetical protein
MQIAIVLYPGFTALDVVGPYEVLGRLPGVEVVFVAEDPGLVVNDLGSLSISAVAGLDAVTKPDIVVVGGGPGQLNQMEDGKLHDWLRTVDGTTGARHHGWPLHHRGVVRRGGGPVGGTVRHGHEIVAHVGHCDRLRRWPR